MAIRKTTVSVPGLGLVAVTRVLMGGGLALLLGERLGAEQRKAVGWTLFLVGALSTLPLGLEVFGRGRLSADRPVGEDRLGSAA